MCIKFSLSKTLVGNLTSDAINCFLTHCVQNLVEDFREWFDYLFCYTSRNFFIIRLCYSAGNTRKRIAVSAERNGLANGILKIRGAKKAGNRLRYSSLAAIVPSVDRMPILIGFMKVVSVRLMIVFITIEQPKLIRNIRV